VHTKHDELRLLVNSRHPIITVETPEEERFEQLLLEVAAELGVPMYEWSVTAGLAKYAGAPLQNTDQPELVWRKPGNNCLLDFRAREAFTSHGEFREVKRGRVASLGEIRSTQPLSVTRAEEVHSSRQWAKTRAAPAD
jgi:hypothetical protein